MFKIHVGISPETLLPHQVDLGTLAGTITNEEMGCAIAGSGTRRFVAAKGGAPSSPLHRNVAMKTTLLLAAVRICAVTLVVLALAQLTPAQVVAGPVVNPANGNSYYLLADSSWTSAESQARSLGGHLATVNNTAENTWIFSTFHLFGGIQRSLWIGLNDVQVEGTFVWTSGEPVNFQFWHSGEPNNVGGIEDHVHMQASCCGWPAPGEWNDIRNAPPHNPPICGVVEVPRPRWMPPCAQPVLQARVLYAMAHDTVLDRVMVFGGNSGSAVLGDLQQWNGGGWTPCTASGSAPRARAYHAMAYDPVRQTLVLFGGRDQNTSTNFGDTWELTWSGTVCTWTQVAATSLPGERTGARMVYDPVRGGVVLFGGQTSSPTIGDLLVRAGTGPAWAVVSGLGTGPSPRWSHGLSFDAARGELVVFGGESIPGASLLNDTWRVVNGVWVTGTYPAPSPRDSFGLAWSPLTNRVVVFGGRVGAGRNETDETWQWDGATPGWSLVGGPRPPARHSIDLAWHGGRNELVTVGGNDVTHPAGRDDTWVFGVPGLAGSHAVAGAGCPGSLGPVTLQAPSGPPFVGSTFEVEVVNALAPGGVFLAIGFSGQNPLGLGPYGLTGCSLHVVPVVWPFQFVVPFVPTIFRIAIPCDASFCGLPLYEQAFVLDPGANNPAGFVVSNAGASVTGCR